MDSSILVRAYLSDEAGHALARDLVWRGEGVNVTSALTEVELTSAIRAAGRARRIASAERLLARLRADLAAGGTVTPIALDPPAVLACALRLCDGHRLRTLDAIHLAVALVTKVAIAADSAFVFTTADRDQAEAARREGLRVEMP